MLEYILTFILGGAVTGVLVTVFGLGILSPRIEDQNTKNLKPEEIIEPSKPEKHLILKVVDHGEENRVKEEINTITRVKPPPKSVISSYTSADIVTIVNKHNICCAIFKNPDDKKTHFYKYRYRVRKKTDVNPSNTNDEDDCPIELRNIAATIRLWGKHWSNISNIKICQYSCSVLEEESKWLSRLEDQQEDCQNKYGCRVSFQDVEFVSKIDRNVFDSLSQRILNSSISEDDLIYFNGKDDSSFIDRTYFDL